MSLIQARSAQQKAVQYFDDLVSKGVLSDSPAIGLSKTKTGFHIAVLFQDPIPTSLVFPQRIDNHVLDVKFIGGIKAIDSKVES